MPKIQLLDERTANQIAAGEVVERPASVVKELVENALDAGASRVFVEVEAGGRNLIRVVDDGSGMSNEDARLCLQRHATSKIRVAEDLLAVSTFGFRGEAVPSVASVSRFELVTREAHELSGYRIEVEGGTIVSESEIGAPPGTRVTVTDLFYNVPARLKYLKSTATEMGLISDTLIRLAMANPGVAIRFHSGTGQLFATPGTGELMATLATLLGRDLTKELLRVEFQENGLRVEGYIGRPGIARAGRNHQYFFVNHRTIRTLQARYALEEAYAHLLPGGRYPVAILFLSVPPHEVDINVHPAKAEVRFEREREVRGAVYKAARQTLGANLLIPGTTITAEGEVVIPTRADEKAALLAGSPWSTGAAAGGGWIPPGASRPGEGGGRATPPPWQEQVSFRLSGAHTTDRASEDWGSYLLPAGGIQGAISRRVGTDSEAVGEESWATGVQRLEGAGLIRALRPLGQVHRSYIACDGPEGLYLIDQHAAHERIFFERLMAAAAAVTPAVQPLLFPISLDLTATQIAIWAEYEAIFAESGFEAQPFGGTTLLIQGVPAGMVEAHTARLIADFLDRLQESGLSPGGSPSDRRHRVVAAMAACKAAIKAKDPLQPEELTALLADLAACQSPATCPHGRPTVICVGTAELKKRFKR